MTIEINVKHNLADLERELGLYGTKLMLAGVRAINRSMPTVRKHSVDEMRDDYPGLRSGAIRGQIKLERATADNPRGVVTFSNKRFRLYGNWVRTQTKRSGVRASRLPYRIETLDGETVPPQILRHAFIQRPKDGGAINVWIRIGTKRYPITGLLGPSLSSTLVERSIKQSAVAVGHQRFRIALAQEARFRKLKGSS